MNEMNLIVVAGISLIVCLVSGASKSWNVFCLSLIILFFSMFGLVMRNL